MNVLIDCGSNIGQGYEKLAKELKIDSDWTVFMFEPNSRCVAILQDKYKDFNIVNKAVWIRDEKRNLLVEYCPIAKDWIGGSTNIIDYRNFIIPKRVQDDQMQFGGLVDCIDFSKFLKTMFTTDSNIVVKMDIEGAEFDVLDKMIADNSIYLVRSIYVEWHQRLINDKKDIKHYISFFHENNIEYKEWF